MTQPYARSQELPSATSKASDVKQVIEKPAKSKHPSASSQQYLMKPQEAPLESGVLSNDNLNSPDMNADTGACLWHCKSMHR